MDVLILTTPGCASCAKVKAILDNLGVKYKVIDVTEEPEILEKYPIMGAPGIVINGKLEFTGGATEEELKKKLNL